MAQSDLQLVHELTKQLERAKLEWETISDRRWSGENEAHDLIVRLLAERSHSKGVTVVTVAITSCHLYSLIITAKGEHLLHRSAIVGDRETAHSYIDDLIEAGKAIWLNQLEKMRLEYDEQER